MSLRDNAKKFGKKVEKLGRDVRDSQVGQKITDVGEDIGKSVRDWFQSDKVQSALKEVENKFIDVRDDLVKSLKPLPKDKQEEALKIFDDYKSNSDESLKQSENEGDFNSKSESILSNLFNITENLRGSKAQINEPVSASSSEYLDPLDDSVLSGDINVTNDNDII